MSSGNLNIMTCGNVDDGKSTLLGRLLYETNNIQIDQSDYISNLSRKKNKNFVDYSLLLDGLIDEKAQGITIDIAFKYFKIGKKNAVLIDSPGHVEYTKNMANAATFANVALVIFDVSKKLNEQTKNHLRIVGMFPNIRKIIVCYNKIDKVNFSKSIFEESKKSIENFTKSEKINIDFHIPVSALLGDNVTTRSSKLKFYKGPNLLELLENITFNVANKKVPPTLPIQFLEVYDGKRFYYSKNIGSILNLGDELINLKTNEKSKIKKIYNSFESVDQIKKSNLVFELDDEISVVGGDVLSKSEHLPHTDSLKARIFCTSKNGIIPKKRYLFKFNHSESFGFLSPSSKSKNIEVNSITEIKVELEKKQILADYKYLYELSNFIIIDSETHETVGFGYIKYSLDKGWAIQKQTLLTYTDKVENKAIWFTGLPGSGKTTIANSLGEYFKSIDKRFYILDGDNIRTTISKDLGFSLSDRIESNRRVAHIAKILLESGVTPIISTVSPTEDLRSMAIEIIGKENIKLIYLSTPLEVCIERDPKGLYKSKNKKIKNITGLNSNYEAPSSPDIVIDTSLKSISKTLDTVLQLLNVK